MWLTSVPDFIKFGPEILAETLETHLRENFRSVLPSFSFITAIYDGKVPRAKIILYSLASVLIFYLLYYINILNSGQ
jgi:hypothetical protein